VSAVGEAGDAGHGRRSGPPVRALVVVLIVQLVLGAGIVFAAVNGFPIIGGGGSAHDAGTGTQRTSTTTGPAPATAPRPTIDRFDARRAFGLLRRQVDVFGPRPAGSPAARRLAAWAKPQLPGGRFEPVPGHAGLRNVVGTLPGRRPAILVAAHYDTVDTPAGMPGANDGAAGTAVLLELARALRAAPRPPRAREVRFVLFDGEEAPGDRDFLRTGLRGSRAYARAHARDTAAMILLDYVGDRDLSLPREGSSDGALWRRLRAAAADVGVGRAFPDRTGGVVYDDHTPFLDAGVPAIDLIDWPYRWMHTLQDTVDKTSPRSLDAVGEAVFRLVSQLART
jgi:glutaminyl-peptide cyclotransferase